MQLSLEILDHIFSFLVSHRETLIACSKDPVLSPIIERHLYYHMVVKVGHGATDPDNAYEPDHLSKLISENPRILYHVRILQLHVNDFWRWDQNWSFTDFLDEFSKTLLMFPVLECVMFTLRDARTDEWSWSDHFRAALENCLRLPTLKEIHLTGSRDFPFSILDHCKTIENLTLLEFFIAEGRYCDLDLPQLKSLALITHFISSSLLAWVKHHINGLQSLTCGFSSMALLPEILGVCSGTLKNLEVDLTQSPYFSLYTFRTGEIRINRLPELPFILPNLQRLCIRAAAGNSEEHTPKSSLSYLPAAAEAIKSFTSSHRLGQLILDIDIINLCTFSHFTEIDFSPLAVLSASLSIPRID